MLLTLKESLTPDPSFRHSSKMTTNLPASWGHAKAIFKILCSLSVITPFLKVKIETIFQHLQTKPNSYFWHHLSHSWQSQQGGQKQTGHKLTDILSENNRRKCFKTLYERKASSNKIIIIYGQSVSFKSILQAWDAFPSHQGTSTEICTYSKSTTKTSKIKCKYATKSNSRHISRRDKLCSQNSRP